MARRHLVWRALLLVGALVITGYLILKYEIAIVLFRSIWNWLVYAGRWIWMFVRAVTWKATHSWVIRKSLEPLWRAVGLTALAAYLVRSGRRHVGPRISVFITRVKTAWARCPWYVKAIVLVGGVALALSFGVGLWLIPFGVPFYTRIAAKIQVKLADSWLTRKTRTFRMKWRCLLRRNRNRFVVRRLRGSRYWLIRRERRTTAWADRKVRALTGALSAKSGSGHVK
ncbi:MAG: hypothetical protein WD049_04650 [Candidatus Paceibacterota bacterium]